MAVLRVLAVLAVLVLAACAPQRSVRIEPRDTPRPAPRGVPADGGYTVVRGDTLYGIAFRHGMDYRELAALNGISAPYTIYPGQTLRLRSGSAPAATVSAPASSPSSTPAGKGVVASVITPPAAGTTGKAPAGSATTSTSVPATARQATSAPPASNDASASTTGAASPAAGNPAGAGTGVAASGTPPADAAASPTAAATPATAPAAPVTLPSGDPRWQWPADGALIGRFVAGDPTRQGINVAGSSGDAVRAAADGVVVYSGAGLIGYGELIIVKHNETWLSAYGHNRKRLVGEGDAVRAGQTIAEMGRTGTSRDMLHFEVRRNGKPVDPLGVLPKR